MDPLLLFMGGCTPHITFEHKQALLVRGVAEHNAHQCCNGLSVQSNSVLGCAREHNTRDCHAPRKPHNPHTPTPIINIHPCCC